MDELVSKHIKEHSLKNKDKECCGIVYLDKCGKINTVETKNIHPEDSSFFEISIDDIAFVKNNYEILAIYHSHTNSSREPSNFDILNSEELCLPFYIYSVRDDNFYLYKPESQYKKTIIGRKFVEDIYNCISCVADYLIQNLKIKISKPINWSEPPNKQSGNDRVHQIFLSFKDYSNASCELIKPTEQIKNMDVLVTRCMRDEFYHFGVVTKDFKILHHPKDQLAHYSDFDEKWRKRLKFIYRLKV